MKRALSFVCASLLALTLFTAALPAQVALAAGSDGAVTYRALSIGNAAYEGAELEAPEYDAAHMQALFAQMSFDGVTIAPDNNKWEKNLTKSGIKKAIAAAFAGADANDVSYFYYSGHGSVANGQAQLVGTDLAFLSVSELKGALDAIPGRKVVLLDSCFSGGFVDENKKKAGTDQAALTGKALKQALGDSQALKDLAEQSTWNGGELSDTSLFASALRRARPTAGRTQQELFQTSVSNAFDGKQTLAGSGYTVVSAASAFQYSYEFPFSALFGPLFTMDGVDLAERSSAYSGEFTGMLIAGVGKVTFHTTYGEAGLLADYNGDNKITADELTYYCKGAVAGSTVQVQAADGDEVLFQHAAASVNGPRVSLGGGDIPAAVTTGASSTAVTVAVDVPANAKNATLYICRRDPTTLASAEEFIDNDLLVRKLPITGTGSASVVWDGKDAKGKAVLDGTYALLLGCDAGLVNDDDPPVFAPGATLIFKRGVTVAGTSLAFTNGVATGKATAVTYQTADSFYLTPTLSGAMTISVNGDTNGDGKLDVPAYLELTDEDGNVLYATALAAEPDMIPDGTVSSGLLCEIFLPCVVRKDKTYRLDVSLSDAKSAAKNITFTARLTTPVSTGSTISFDKGTAYNARVLQPDADGEYVVMSSGSADTAAVLVDGNQTSYLAESDNYVDQNYLLRAQLQAGKSYLLVTAGDQKSAYTCTMVSAGDAKVNTSNLSKLSAGSSGGFDKDPLTNTKGAPTLYKIVVGSKPEKWTFETTASLESETYPELDKDNDPFAMVIGTDYRLVGQSDDYDDGFSMDDLEDWDGTSDPEDLLQGSQESRFSVILEAGKTYVLVVRNAQAKGYGFAFHAERSVLSTVTVPEPLTAHTMTSSAQLDGYGNVLTWGIGIMGELGNGAILAMSEQPTPVYMPDNDKATALWAGEDCYVARYSSGYYWWGVQDSSESGYAQAPTKLNCLDGKTIRQIVASMVARPLVLTMTGEVYQLDLAEDTLTSVKLPSGVHSAREIGIIEGMEEEATCYALANNGVLYTWDDGEDYDSGDYLAAKPKKVSLSGTVAHISAGAAHVVALTDTGKLYAWGYGEQGQLGNGSTSNASKPTTMGLPSGAGTVRAIVAQGYETMVLAQGGVYVCGDNSVGQLGLGHSKKVKSLTKVEYYDDHHLNVVDMGATGYAVFARDDHNRVYGYGSTGDYQLGVPAAEAPDDLALLFTLRGSVAQPSTALAAVYTTAGRVSLSQSSVTVTLAEGSATCYLVPAPAYRDATYQIDGKNCRDGAGKYFELKNPGDTVSATITVHCNGQNKAYTVKIVRSKSANTAFKSLGLSAGAKVSPALSGSKTAYTITVPETEALTIQPVLAGYGATYTYDGVANGKASYGVAEPAVGKSLTDKVVVTAQSGAKRTYTLTIKRAALLKSASAKPTQGGVPALSPGGTNRMTVSYALSFAAKVKIQVQKKGDSGWETLYSGKQKAGSHTWQWDGKVDGDALAAGDYSLRITPSYGGESGTAKTIDVKILRKTTVYVSKLSTYNLKANGHNQMVIRVKWSEVSDVRVTIVNSKGKTVRTLWKATNQQAGATDLAWDGRNDDGKLVPAGTYRAVIKAGGVKGYRQFKVSR